MHDLMVVLITVYVCGAIAIGTLAGFGAVLSGYSVERLIGSILYYSMLWPWTLYQTIRGNKRY